MSPKANESSGFTIASKSIPRAGHHLIKSILKAGFGDRFVHCEWYQEPGCCRQIPCKLHQAYCSYGQTLQFIKSHDFSLDDPILGPREKMVTLVSYRHPLWSMTSNFVYCLSEAGARRIGVANKMPYLHEPAVVHELTKQCHVHLSDWPANALDRWLAEQVTYQIKFFRKWLAGKSDRLSFNDSEGILSCPYEKIDSKEGARLLVGWLARQSGIEAEHLSDQKLEFIKPGRDPWSCSNEEVAEFLHGRREAFAEAAACVIRETGLSYSSDVKRLVHSSPWTGVSSELMDVETVTRRDGTNTSLRSESCGILADENLALRQKCDALSAELQQSADKMRMLEKDWGVRAGKKVSKLLTRITRMAN